MKWAVGMAVGLALIAGPVQAQRHEGTIEGHILGGAAGYARHVSPSTLIGLEVGFGFPQIDLTLTPAEDDATAEPGFEEYLHLAVFLRHRMGERFEVDTGLRGSIADLWECTASDCWPATFAGGYIQPMFGWERVKIGTRLTAGWIAESQGAAGSASTFVAAIRPFIVRVTLR